MTIEEYASKWAVVEHRAVAEYDKEFCTPSRQSIFYRWAVDDPDSPIAAALKAGTPEQEVEGQFHAAYQDMLALLARMEG